jgi:ribosomal protein L32
LNEPPFWRGMPGPSFFFSLHSIPIDTMSFRLIASTKSVLQQQSIVKVQASRFGTISLSNALFNNNTLSESVTRNTFEIPSWLEPILWAAPKKKTSHSKKRMRASNKGLQQKENVTTCPACGSNKLLHHLCGNCYSDIKKKAKSQVAIDA